MSIESTHPEYDAKAEDWAFINCSAEGQRAVKKLGTPAGTAFLPKTNAMILMDILDTATTVASEKAGTRRYESYKLRAVYPEIIRNALPKLIGFMNAKPAGIKLPTRLEPLLDKATSRNESLHALQRQIQRAQLVNGRIGVLLEVDDRSDLPFFVTYSATRAINWNDNPLEEEQRRILRFVVLNETRPELNEDADPLSPEAFEWRRGGQEKRFRALMLERGIYTQRVTQNPESLVLGEAITPDIRQRTRDFIPFLFFGANDINVSPDDIPLLPAANLAHSIYLMDADYKELLHNAAGETLVISGTPDAPLQPINPNDVGKERLVGAGGEIRLPSGGDAKYIGPESQALAETREAIEHNENKANELANEFASRSRQVEAAEAIHMREAVRTSSLVDIALTSAKGIEIMLKWAAEWVGADPEEVSVEPNLDFVQDLERAPEQLSQLMGAKTMGALIAHEDMYDWMKKRDLVKAPTFEEQVEKVRAEGALTEELRPEPEGGEDPVENNRGKDDDD